MRPFLLSVRKRLSIAPETWLLALTFVLGSIVIWYVYDHDLMTVLTDQSSHLNFARLTFDSITPGVSQLGFWPPLLHVLLIPFVAIPFLYETGLAAVPILLPCLMFSVWLLYRITLQLTKNEALAFTAGMLFLLNPYVLYYSATPMMEMLFITNVFLATFLMLRWLDTEQIGYLLGVGLALTLACLSRFEGFLLLPIASLIVLLRSLGRRWGYAQTEAVLILFGLLSIIGVFIIIAYSWVYGDDPLAFAGGGWLRDPGAAQRPSRFSFDHTFQSVAAASSYMLGEPLVLLCCISALILFLFPRQLFERIAALLMLCSPLLFVIITLYLGFITINLPEFPPYAVFHNDRYGLTWIGFAVLPPLLLLHDLWERMNGGWKYVRLALKPVGVLLVGVLLVQNGMHFYSVVFAENFEVIRENINSPLQEQRQVTKYLREHYDGGKVLAARMDNDPIFAAAGIPLKNYIYEGNYLYFDQALREPWFFAQWVLMHNPTVDGWVEANEPVYRALAESEEFLQYYDLVLKNDKRRLYRLNENHLLHMVKEKGFDPGGIPSLNPQAALWDPSTVYRQMHIQEPERVPPAKLVRSKAAVKSQLMDFYWRRLKPDYSALGVVTDGAQKGISESQSYALLQSLAVDDPEIFDRVWQWTKRNIQQPGGLFAWKYTVTPEGGAIIDDANSATDADTDIAYALLQAGRRWTRQDYIEDARSVIDGIWEQEVALLNGDPHIIAGNWASQSGTLVLNPSYFSPVAYRLFAEVDPHHEWLKVIDAGYDDLYRATELMRETTGMNLPPDWVQVNVDTLTYEPFSEKGRMEYSFDAFRTLWRLAQDAQESGDARAIQYLSSLEAFDREWEEENRLCTLYILSSPIEPCHFDMGTLAGALSVWMIRDPDRAEEMLKTFSLASGTVRLPQRATFYEKTWYWFMLWQWTES